MNHVAARDSYVSSGKQLNVPMDRGNNIFILPQNVITSVVSYRAFANGQGRQTPTASRVRGPCIPHPEVIFSTSHDWFLVLKEARYKEVPHGSGQKVNPHGMCVGVRSKTDSRRTGSLYGMETTSPGLSPKRRITYYPQDDASLPKKQSAAMLDSAGVPKIDGSSVPSNVELDRRTRVSRFTVCLREARIVIGKGGADLPFALRSMNLGSSCR